MVVQDQSLWLELPNGPKVGTVIGIGSEAPEIVHEEERRQWCCYVRWNSATLDGHSGAPVLNEAGELVGVYVGVMREDDTVGVVVMLSVAAAHLAHAPLHCTIGEALAKVRPFH